MDRNWVLPVLIMLLFSFPKSTLCQDKVNVTVLVNNQTVVLTVLPSVAKVLGSLLDEVYSVTPGDQVIDINECDTPVIHSCPDNSTCIDLSKDSGHYKCICDSDLIFNGTHCLDDACLAKGNTCNSTQQCDLTSGECVCGSGFVELSDGECELLTSCFKHMCPPNSVCSEFNGTDYQCTCNGNGGYEKKGGGNDSTIVCGDVDECFFGSDTCHTEATCENNEGSYSCACNEGYSGDGHNCEDIDECQDPDSCPRDCENTPGSYNCYLIQNVVIDFSAVIGRKKRSTPSDFENELESYFMNMLSVFVDVTVAGGTAPPYTLSFDAPLEYLSAITYELENLPGKTIGGRTVSTVVYPTEFFYSGTFNISGTLYSNNSTACDAIVNHINVSTNGTTTDVTCAGTLTGDILDFTIELGGKNSDFNLNDIMESFTPGSTSQDTSCACKNPESDCELIHGRPFCICKNSYHDTDKTDPGFQCVNPIKNVTCDDRNIGVTLYETYFHRIGLDPSKLHLLDSTCKGTIIDEWLVFNKDVTECSTITTHNGQTIVYANEVTNLINGVMTSNPSIKFEFSCSYSANFNTTDDQNEEPTSVEILSSTITINQTAAGSGSLSLTTTIYQDSSFTSPLPIVSIVAPGDSLYILVEHSSTVMPNFLKLRTCYLTPTSDPNGSEQFPLITDSCPTSPLVSNFQSGLTENASFTLQAIKFPGHDKFFVHCTVTVCNSLCNETCPMTAGRRLRASDNNFMTVGPVRTSDPESEIPIVSDEDSITPPAADNTGGAVGAVIGVVAAVAITVFVVWKRKHSKGPPSTPSHFNDSSAVYYNTGFSTSAEYADCPSRISRRN